MLATEEVPVLAFRPKNGSILGSLGGPVGPPGLKFGPKNGQKFRPFLRIDFVFGREKGCFWAPDVGQYA